MTIKAPISSRRPNTYMTLHQDIPFFENTPDNTHCFQAAFKMVLKYFLPEEDFSFEELDKITAKKEGLWTWPLAGVVWMQERGFEVKSIDRFNLHKFIEKGGQYIIDEYGSEVGEAQIKNSDIEQERRLAKQFLDLVETEVRIPQKEDILSLMERGYVVTINLNAKVLNNKEGYSGHSVVITGLDAEKIFLHDPGVPGVANRGISYDTFEKAWAYPHKEAKNILAFKLKKEIFV